MNEPIHMPKSVEDKGEVHHATHILWMFLAAACVLLTLAASAWYVFFKTPNPLLWGNDEAPTTVTHVEEETPEPKTAAHTLTVEERLAELNNDATTTEPRDEVKITARRVELQNGESAQPPFDAEAYNARLKELE